MICAYERGRGLPFTIAGVVASARDRESLCVKLDSDPNCHELSLPHRECEAAEINREP